MAKEETKAKTIVLCILFCLLFVLVPILWLIPLSFGNLIEFTVYYEDSTYFTIERASGIDVLLDGVYYGTTDGFGVLEIRMPDQENHTMSILYNDGVVYEYLIEYGTEITTMDVFLETKSLESVFRWNTVGEQDLVIGEQFELWYNRAGVFELVGTQTTNSLGMVLFDGLIMGEYKGYKMYFYSYKFIGVNYEIPEDLIELNQSTAFLSEALLVEPITVMFDFEYMSSVIFGDDYPVEDLEYTFWRFYQYGWDAGQPKWQWEIISTGYTDVDGRIYFYNLETFIGVDGAVGNNYKITWNYDGVGSEQTFLVGDDLDYFYELACKEVSATFNWDAVGYPLAIDVDVVLTFLDGTHTPMVFTTDVNGQLTISGLIMGDYDLAGVVFATIQSEHSAVIPQILLEPTKDRGNVFEWFKKHYTIMLILIIELLIPPGFLSFIFRLSFFLQRSTTHPLFILK